MKKYSCFCFLFLFLFLPRPIRFLTGRVSNEAKQQGGVRIPTWEPVGEGQHCLFGLGGRVVDTEILHNPRYREEHVQLLCIYYTCVLRTKHIITWPNYTPISPSKSCWPPKVGEVRSKWRLCYSSAPMK